MSDDWYSIQISEKEIRREREKARELRRSQWWKGIIARGLCHYCEGKFSAEELTMDHVVPIARGGKSSKGNLVPACKACNSKKKLSTPVEDALKALKNNEPESD